MSKGFWAGIYDFSPQYLHNCGILGSNNIVFDEEHHIYKVNDFERPSVSKILETVFGNRFGGVKPEVLERARKKGTEVHKEILEFTVDRLQHPISPEAVAACYNIEKIGEGDMCACEQILFCDNEYVPFCCTIDAFWLFKNYLLVDYKTSYALDKKHVTRQLNLYAYALRKNGYCADKLEAWHLKDGTCKRVKIELKDDWYCEKILEAYITGKTFKDDNELISYYNAEEFGDDDKKLATFDKLAFQMKQLDEMIKKLSVAREECANRVMGMMKFSNMLESHTNGINIVYIPKEERKSFDSKKLKDDLPDVYKKYIKTSEVAEHIRVTYKETKNAD